ncbi:hypothetical protein AX15_002191 [Amanita polypyramis BW_CC]|nr:hypothetical protein AX15_002191 [Amanita polypyramis BW_CC]
MSVPRTARGISKIPGVSTFRSSLQPPSLEKQVVSLRPCSSCKKEFIFPHNTSWEDITRSVNEHQLLCDKKRAAASANAKKRWQKEKPCRSDAQHQTLRKADVNIKQKKMEGKKARDQKMPNKTCRNLTERKILLENDPWTVTELDKRRLYYPGLWLKHKDKCTGISQITSVDVTVLPAAEQSSMNHRSKRRKQSHETERPATWYVAERELACIADVGMHDVSCTAGCTQRYFSSDFDILDVPPTSSMSLNAIMCPVSAAEIEIRARYGLIRSDEGASQCRERPEYEVSRNFASCSKGAFSGTPSGCRSAAQKTSCQDGASALPPVISQERDVLQSSCTSQNSLCHRRPRKGIVEKSSRRNGSKQVSSGGITNSNSVSCSSSTVNENEDARRELSTVDAISQKIGSRGTHQSHLQQRAVTVPPDDTLVNISLLSRHASPTPLLLAPHLPSPFQQQETPALDSYVPSGTTAEKTYVAHNPELRNCDYPTPLLRPATQTDFERPGVDISCEDLRRTTSAEDATMDEA